MPFETSVPSITPSPSLSGFNGLVPFPTSSPFGELSLSQSVFNHVILGVNVWLASINEQGSDGLVPFATSWPFVTPSPSQSEFNEPKHDVTVTKIVSFTHIPGNGKPPSQIVTTIVSVPLNPGFGV